MEGRRLAHGAAPPLTAVERFLYGQKNDALCSKRQECSRDRPIVKTKMSIEIRSDNKENMTFAPRKEKHLVLNGGNSTKKRPYKNLIKGQWTAEEDRYIYVYVD